MPILNMLYSIAQYDKVKDSFGAVENENFLHHSQKILWKIFQYFSKIFVAFERMKDSFK